MKHRLFQTLKTIVLALVLSFGLSYVYAWTAPTVSPPNGNVEAPINTGTMLQGKNGPLGVNGVFHGYSNAYFDGTVTAPTFVGNLIGNADTATNLKPGGNATMVLTSNGTGVAPSWQAAGSSGTLTSLSAGTGITLSSNPITTTGTITNSGVTSIVAGTNVTLSPPSGVGAVTVNAAGASIIYSQYYSLSGVCSTTSTNMGVHKFCALSGYAPLGCGPDFALVTRDASNNWILSAAYNDSSAICFD